MKKQSLLIEISTSNEGWFTWDIRFEGSIRSYGSHYFEKRGEAEKDAKRFISAIRKGDVSLRRVNETLVGV